MVEGASRRAERAAFPFHPSLFGERSPFPASGKGKKNAAAGGAAAFEARGILSR